MRRWGIMAFLATVTCSLFGCPDRLDQPLDLAFGQDGFLSLASASYGASWAVAEATSGNLVVASTSDDRRGVQLTRLRPDGTQAPIWETPFQARFLGEHWLADLDGLPNGKWLLTSTVQTHEGDRHYITFSQFNADGTLNRSFGTNGQTSAKFFFDVWPEDWNLPWPYWAIETVQVPGGWRLIMRAEGDWLILGLDENGAFIGEDPRGELARFEVDAAALHLQVVQSSADLNRLVVAQQACASAERGQTASCQSERVSFDLSGESVRELDRKPVSGWVYDVIADPDPILLSQNASRRYAISFDNAAGPQQIVLPPLEGAMVDSRLAADAQYLYVVLPIHRAPSGMAYVLHVIERETAKAWEPMTIETTLTPQLPHRLVDLRLWNGQLTATRWTPMGLEVSRHVSLTDEVSG